MSGKNPQGDNNDVNNIIEYCIKSMYVDRDTLLENEHKLENILGKKLPDELQKGIHDKIRIAKDEWKKFEGYEEVTDSLKIKGKIINDSVHKSIVLNALEVAVIDTPEFSRLRGIKQLGAACFVYPGAVHTRFEHSIGVCHLAGQFMDILKKKIKIHDSDKTYSKTATIQDKEEQCVRLAALCHDLGHGPFSHMFQKLRKKIVEQERNGFEEMSHEEISVLLFKHLLVNNMKVLARFHNFGLTWEHVWMIEFMIDPGEESDSDRVDKDKKEKTKISQERSFLYEIVANKDSGMDVDKWDYYARDCHYLGVTNEFDPGRLMELSGIVTEVKDDQKRYHIGFQKKEEYNIYRMFRTRTVLYQKAYVHQVVDAVEMMITDALLEIRNKNILFIGNNGNCLTDVVLQLVKNSDSKMITKIVNLDFYIALKDSILDIIENLPSNSSDDKIMNAQEILKNLKKRQLYWCCSEIVIPGEGFEDLEAHKKNIEILENEDVSGEDVSKKLEIEAPKIAYCSEKVIKNPVKNIHFYKLGNNAPEVSMDKGLVSDLHTPKTFEEYRVRLYCKEEKTRKRTSDESKERYKELLAKRIRRK